MARPGPSEEVIGCIYLTIIIITGVFWYCFGLPATVAVLCCCFLLAIACSFQGNGKKDQKYRKLYIEYKALEESYKGLNLRYQNLEYELKSKKRTLDYGLESRKNHTEVFSTKQTCRETSQREYYTNLSALGFQNYEAYLMSDVWKATKERYNCSEYPKFCLVCGSKYFELHHRTYERLGHEELYDLVPLCSPHHEALHIILDQNPQLSVKDTHDYLIRLNHSSQQKDHNMPQPLLDVNEQPDDDDIPF